MTTLCMIVPTAKENEKNRGFGGRSSLTGSPITFRENLAPSAKRQQGHVKGPSLRY